MANDDENTNNNELTLYGEYTIDNMMQQAKNIHQFCDLVRNMSRNNAETALHVLVNKKGCTAEDRMQIYELIRYLLIEKEYFHIYPENLKYDNNFKQFISQHISNVFQVNDDDNELKRVEILTQFLYDDKFRPSFDDSPRYNIVNRFFEEYDGSWIFGHMYQNLLTQSLNLIENDDYIYKYLSTYSIAPFKEGPVALLFSGGCRDEFPDYYSNEMNCCILSHHLYEMGYNKENIMCFVEENKDNIDISPFKNNMIHVFHDKVLCSYDNFRSKLNYNLFTQQLNSSDVFEYLIFKAVMDAKGPILIYFNHQGSKNYLYFPYPPYAYKRENFEKLFPVLDTFHKNILFIFDCDGSEEFIPKFPYSYIHFITSSINKTDNPELFEESLSFSTMSFKTITNKSLVLSSQFTRHLMDSLYLIKQETSLADFVEIINSSSCVGFKAKLRSDNQSLPVSIFLQSPTFKYFNYGDQIDNFREGDLRIFAANNEVKCELPQIVIKDGIIDINNKENIFRDISMSKKVITADQVIKIIDIAVLICTVNYKQLYDKTKSEKVPEDFNENKIYDLLLCNNQLQPFAEMYAKQLIHLYSCFPIYEEVMMNIITDFVQNFKK